MSRDATDTAGYVIRCTGIHGAYGQPAPTGMWLLAYDPRQADTTGTFRGLTEWTPRKALACRFPTEAAAAECVESGLARTWRTRIEPIPDSRPPVIDGRYSQLLRGRPLTEEERAAAQDAVDRLWLGGHLR